MLEKLFEISERSWNSPLVLVLFTTSPELASVTEAPGEANRILPIEGPVARADMTYVEVSSFQPLPCATRNTINRAAIVCRWDEKEIGSLPNESHLELAQGL